MISRVLLILALLTGGAFAQGPILPGPGLPVAAAGCADSNVIAWKAAVVTAGGTVSSTQEGYVCTLVASLKAHSLFTVMDRIFLLASENSQQSLIDIVNLGAATNSGSTFAASQGYTGNGSSSFVNTGFAPSTGPNYTQNSASYSVYVRTSRTSSANKEALGSVDAAGSGVANRFFPLASNTIINPINNNANGFAQFTNPVGNAQGFYTVSRTGSATVNTFRNSSSTTLNAGTDTAGAPPNLNFYIGAGNNNGAGEFFSDDQIAIVAIGAGLSNTNAAQLQTDLNAYMTSLGTNVY